MRSNPTSVFMSTCMDIEVHSSEVWGFLLGSYSLPGSLIWSVLVWYWRHCKYDANWCCSRL